MVSVRLTPKEIQVISQAFRKHFGKDDHLWLFGSRVDMQKRGGDIDLYVETQKDSAAAVSSKLSFVTDIWTQIGEQKIDVVLHLMSFDYHLPIYDVAKTEGVLLV